MPKNIFGKFKGEPWPYQAEDASKIARMKFRAMLGHKTGLGKTFIALLAASRMSGCERVLITGTKSSLAVWMKEVPRWTEAEVFYIGRNTPKRDETWANALTKPGVWLVNHAMFRILMKDTFKSTRGKKPHWDLHIDDETHKGKNRKSQLFETKKKVSSSGLLQLSATLASRGAQDMWTYLHLINPKLFSSYWRFVETFCFVEKSGFGYEVFGTRNAEALKDLLRGYYLTRTYEEVKPDLPPLRRQLIEVEMDPPQAKLYQEFDEQMILEKSDGSLLIASGVLAKVTRLRQLSLCPRILDPGYPLGICVDSLLDDLEGYDDKHVVVFSVFTQILEVVQQELISQGYKVEFLRGGLEPEQVNEVVSRWKHDRSIMLCAIAFAQSFALDTVRNAAVIGVDLDPDNNIQAEGRLRRADSMLPPEGVLVKYYIPLGTREEVSKEILNGKVLTVRQFLEDFGR